ncbi:MAG: endolytic transglycosylase MltG [Thermodesulfobacteriota bacterium]
MPFNSLEPALRKWATVMARIIIPAIIVLSPMYWFYSYGTIPGPGPVDGDEVRVAIPPGKGFQGVYWILVDNDVIEEDLRFGILASWRGVSKKLKAGEYVFARPATPGDVLEKIVEGTTLLHPLTFQEGLTMYQVVEELSRQGWGGQEDLLDLCHDPDFIASLGVQGASLEGYLFPDTYYLSRSQDGRAVLKMMVERFFEVSKTLEQLEAALSEPAEKGAKEMTLHETVILASIIEKETGAAVERPQIARVFLNRLKKKMRLQADPTVIYGIGDFDGDLTRRDLRTPSAYNTYLLKGLPAGPIANPGKDSLKAVLQPAEGNWLYFVARGDGTHYFSNNLKEHNRAVYKFQKKGK